MSDSANQVHAGQSEAGPVAADAKFARRRRLLKIGASGVPVALTLTSRSVLAGTCTTTSAWGSTQLMNTASVNAHHNSFTVSTSSLATWQAATSSAPGPFTTLYSAKTFGFGSAALLFSGLTVNQLFDGAAPTAWSTALKGAKVKDAIKSTATTSTSFQRMIIVAALNVQSSTTSNKVSSCTTIAELKVMGKASTDGPYTTANGLTLSTVLPYLAANYLAF